jgi:hypothetical protein
MVDMIVNESSEDDLGSFARRWQMADGRWQLNVAPCSARLVQPKVYIFLNRWGVC